MTARGIFARILSAQLVVALVSVAALGLTLDRIFEHRALVDLERRLIAEARLTEAAIAREGVTQGLVRALGAASGARLTIIRTDGVVLADSEHDPASMENHARRGEVRAALAGRSGIAQRISETIGVAFLYVALPARGELITRAALPATRVANERARIRTSLALAFIATAVLSILVSGVITRTVANPLRDLTENVRQVAARRSAHVEVRGPREAQVLAGAVNQMARDIDVRVEALERETDLREQILSAMTEAVFMSDDGYVAYANEAARELFNIGPSHPIPPMIPYEHGTSTEIEIHHPSRRDIRVVTLRISDRRFLVVCQDITEAKALDATRRDFVANASHEMKTPVAAILATAETLSVALTHDPGAAPGFTDTLVQETRRLSALVTDLLSLARLEEPMDATQAIDLTGVTRSVVHEVRQRCTEMGINFQDDLAPDIHVQGRGADLYLLMRNLADNALRYTATGGTIEISLREEDNQAIVRVRDTGVGIATKDLPRIFERFFRVDQARARATGGTGLGLSIVRHVAEAHGGAVSVESALGSGSTFTVRLPLAT